MVENNISVFVENGQNGHIQSIEKYENQKNKCLACLRSNLLTLLTVFGVFGGVALGFILRSVKEDTWTQREISYVNFIGDIFLRMLKGLILPLIISSLISAIGSLDLSLSGKIGGRAIAYYFITTLSAVILGIILVTTIQPGRNGKLEKPNENIAKNATTADTLLDLLR